MPPKPKGKSKGVKPAWMSQELWEVASDMGKLIENFRGPSDKNTTECTISKEKAGLLLWQMLWPTDTKGKAKREEAVKAELVEAAVKNLALSDDPAAVPAAGLLALLCQSQTGRESLLAAKPPAVVSIQRALGSKTVSLIASVCSLLRTLTSAPETRTKVLFVFREWDWTPLLAACTILRVMGPQGGRRASIECMQSIEALTGRPFTEAEGGSPNDRALADNAKTCVFKAGGLRTMITVAASNSPPLVTGAAAAVTLSLFQHLSSALRQPFQQLGGVKAMVRVMRNTYAERFHRACAAGCLWSFLVPDLRMAPEETDAATLKRTTDRVDAREKSKGAKGATAVGVPAGVGTLSGEDGEHLLLEEMLLDPAERQRVLERCREVAEAGAIPLLVELCAGPEGPMPERSAASSAQLGSIPKKKAGKRSSKKAKLELGMEEAMTYAAGCLRLLSLDDTLKESIMLAGAPRYLPQLLDGKIHQARWHARQALLNLSMVPDFAKIMRQYELPNYVTGGNIPELHYARPTSIAA